MMDINHSSDREKIENNLSEFRERPSLIGTLPISLEQNSILNPISLTESTLTNTSSSSGTTSAHTLHRRSFPSSQETHSSRTRSLSPIEMSNTVENKVSLNQVNDDLTNLTIQAESFTLQEGQAPHLLESPERVSSSKFRASISPATVSEGTELSCGMNAVQSVSSKQEQDESSQSYEQHHRLSSRDSIQSRSTRAEPMACIFVASLNASKNDEQLKESVENAFSVYGQILGLKVMRDSQGRPYAFVQYENVDEAREAIKLGHNQILDDRPVRVEQARVNRTLFVSKYDRQISELKMKEELEEFGSIEEFNFLKTAYSGRSRGCCFVKYRYRDDAIKAFSGLRATHHWHTEWASNLGRQNVQIDPYSIFVGQLDPVMVNENELYAKFGEYGQIEHLQYINKSKYSQNVGDSANVRPAFAFIKYSSTDAALKAVTGENESEWFGRTIRVSLREHYKEPHGATETIPARRPRTHSLSSVESMLTGYNSSMYPMTPPFVPYFTFQPSEMTSNMGASFAADHIQTGFSSNPPSSLTMPADFSGNILPYQYVEANPALYGSGDLSGYYQSFLYPVDPGTRIIPGTPGNQEATQSIQPISSTISPSTSPSSVLYPMMAYYPYTSSGVPMNPTTIGANYPTPMNTATQISFSTTSTPTTTPPFIPYDSYHYYQPKNTRFTTSQGNGTKRRRRTFSTQ